MRNVVIRAMLAADRPCGRYIATMVPTSSGQPIIGRKSSPSTGRIAAKMTVYRINKLTLERRHRSAFRHHCGERHECLQLGESQPYACPIGLIRLPAATRSRKGQTSMPSASASASSRSTPRYRTVFSILAWPSRI